VPTVAEAAKDTEGRTSGEGGGCAAKKPKETIAEIVAVHHGGTSGTETDGSLCPRPVPVDGVRRGLALLSASNTTDYGPGIRESNIKAE